MASKEIEETVLELRKAIKEYDAQVNTYNRCVGGHQDDLDSVMSALSEEAEAVEECRTQLENMLEAFQHAFGGTYAWGELVGDPLKIEYRTAVRELRALLEGDLLPARLEEPTAPEFELAESFEPLDLVKVAALLQEINKERQAHCEVLQQKEALLVTLSQAETSAEELRNTIEKLSTSRAEMLEAIAKTHILLREVAEKEAQGV